MDLQIAGKLALVTGASKGIGFSVAQGLAREGVRVIMSARDEQQLQRAVEQVRLQGGEAFGIPADVSDSAQVEGLFEQLATRFKHPDILVVNAGGPPAGKAEGMPEEAWQKGYELTLMSAVRLAQQALPAMKAQQWGRIVNITSVSVKQPVNNLALSNAFRAGVTGFAKTLSSEVAACGITVNNVGPGYTATERLQQLFQDETAKTQLLSDIPAARFGTPDEVASAVIYLCSQQAAYMTGQTLLVDGGATKGLF